MNRRPPLWLIAAAASAGSGLVVLAVTLAGLGLAGRGGLAGVVGGAGLAGVAGVSGLAGLAARAHAGVLRRLHHDAVLRLQGAEPPAGSRPGRLSRLASREVTELSQVLRGLALRVRLSDEVAARQQHSAQAASSGMFELLSGLVGAEEAARGQLSAELHDTVAQSLMSGRRLLADLGGHRAEPALARASDAVAEAEEQVRALMARTRPPALRDGDLGAAVASLRDDLALRYGLRVDIDWPATPVALPLAVAITVYRFLQEALLNVVKHADVDTAEVCVAITDATISATVRDDGPGFRPAAVAPVAGRHVGLTLLGERARLAGGRLEVTSAPGSGTQLRLTLPVAGVRRLRIAG